MTSRDFGDLPNHIDLANYVLYRANKLGKPITVLHLNKAWYFALGYLVETQEGLARAIFRDSHLEAWLYGAVQIHSFHDPFIEAEVDESIYMNSNDFFEMVEKYAAINLFREAWQKVKDNIQDDKSL